ncbi:NAD-dependent protein deacetylase of SIR2 family [Streptomyces viridochromogenes]|uniref:NAD-dependent protein deacetylase of SIR2 family n=1 Tax=Streptomyces viridochromogenes TaxID=1938 RepID=UPI00069D9D2D|nr:NAD-dependent protein deacetylase of SIR2 family [Streptomyces viridochromogenes]KOG09545.1 NAD-dependent protein deacetylase of SIR2 family [Streptomyces viridochromogenes]KOG09884.1 NAD-dependent protein deacetylase of SIR2 family [Streptomyces viridochromogenes]
MSTTNNAPVSTAPPRETIRAWLEEADRVLIAAGAGLSAAAGYDYGDTERFRELFPALYRLGLRSRYLLGVPLPTDMMWGYWAVHIDDIRYDPEPNPLYRKLRELVGHRDHWVMTSNVDALFARNGFEADRIFTPQGDYGRLQCAVPCSRDTWPSRPFLDAILASYDRDTGRVTDPALPCCPRCGADIFPNVRVGPEFVDDAHLPAGRRLVQWLDDAPTDSTLLVLEIGAGFNTPGVIRHPTENLVRQTPRARLVRINPAHPDVPSDLGERALSVPLGGDRLLDGLEP